MILANKNILTSVLSFMLVLIPCQNQAQKICGLYVDDFHLILGRPDQELKLFKYAAYSGTNSLSLFKLDEVDLRKAESRDKLRRFIRQARQSFGIQRISAVSESISAFTDNIHLYNTDPMTAPSERLDAYLIEFEFWNEYPVKNYYCERYLEPAGVPCTMEGAFNYIKSFVYQLRQLTDEFPEMDLEIYVGWISPEQAASISKMVDRVYYAVYVEMKSGMVELYHFFQQRERLSYLAQSGPIEIVPIFSSYNGGSDPNLNSWLKKGNHPSKAWKKYERSFRKDYFLPGKENLILAGYQWFHYNSMVDIQK